jgi:site-specific recombinase XerD
MFSSGMHRQRLLGHANLETTGRYLHPSAEKLREAVEEL